MSEADYNLNAHLAQVEAEMAASRAALLRVAKAAYKTPETSETPTLPRQPSPRDRVVARPSDYDPSDGLHLRFSTTDLFTATTLISVAILGFSHLFKQDEWGSAQRLPVYFISVMAIGAGVAAPFHRIRVGMWIGLWLGLAYFFCALGPNGIGQLLRGDF